MEEGEDEGVEEEKETEPADAEEETAVRGVIPCDLLQLLEVSFLTGATFLIVDHPPVQQISVLVQ